MPIETRFTQSDADAVERTLGRAAFAPDGTILRVNDRFLELFDYEGWDLVGRNCSILQHDNQTSDESGALGQVLAGGGPFSGDLRQLKRDGTPFWAELSYLPVADEHGLLREVIVLVRDATARLARAADEAGQITAINRSLSVIHFTTDGMILDANPLFLETMGYALEDVVGRHHRMFVDPAEAGSPDYAAFWERLRQGLHASGEYRRLAGDGRPVWLRATYNPIFDLDGRPRKIVKYALDVTGEKKQHADFKGQIAAIDKSQCVASFAPDGTILGANRNFLDAVGYTMDEIEGRHHRMFVVPAHVHGLDYELFWSDLASGQFRGGEFRRVGKNDREIWFKSIFSPVLDQDGRPIKIIEHATEITREKLRQADHQGQIAAIYRSQCVVSFAVDGTILDANENFLELTGYRLSEVRGKHHSMFVASDEREGAAYAGFWTDLAAGSYKSGEFKRVNRDGRELWLQASYNPIYDMQGRPFKVVQNAADVTEQKLRQGDYEGQIAAIRKSQCVVSFDLDGTILDANDNFLRLMGYGLSDIVGRHHRLFVDSALADSAEYAQLWDKLREGQFLSSKFRRVARGGAEIWIQASYNPIYDLNGRPYKIVKIAADITADVSIAADLSRAQNEVQRDAATGLFNRLGLRRFLREALAATDSELALLYLDLDHFKPINDTFGHDVGDHVLKVVSGRLSGEMGDRQAVARIGGDEFAVAAASLSRAGAAELAQRLIDVVSQPIPHRGRHLVVGLSIGIALTPQDTLEEDELFRFADVALYRTKGSRRGTFTFHAEGSETSTEAERHMAHEMRIAIKAKQFVLSCLPRQADAGDASARVEVHPHWEHPSLGRLDEGRFMRVAEQSGLVLPLGDWILRQACKLASGLHGLVVSAPVYAKQLLSSDVPGVLALALRETGLEPRFIELRVERGATRVNPASLRADLARLRAMGVTVSGGGFLIDDAAVAAADDWPMDRLVVDARLRRLLSRQSPALFRELEELEARNAGAVPDAGRRSFEIDRHGVLHSFVALDPTTPDMVAARLGNGGSVAA